MEFPRVATAHLMVVSLKGNPLDEMGSALTKSGAFCRSQLLNCTC